MCKSTLGKLNDILAVPTNDTKTGSFSHIAEKVICDILLYFRRHGTVYSTTEL